MSDTTAAAIEVTDVYKDFVLPHEATNSFKSMFTRMFRRDKGVETQHALRGIDLTVNEGEFYGICGRNGSGKSTLLKIIAGIYQPTAGTVTTHGKLVPFIELGVGFNPELSGRENVYLNGAILGFSRKQIDANYHDIVAFAELEDFMDQKLKNYSSGMQVRLAFACATRAKADILLVDEVLAVGDADFQRKCFDYFRELKKQKKTVVFVSHDMASVREYCDRAVLIEDSRIIKRGTANAIADEYTKLFIPKAPVEEEEGEAAQAEHVGDRQLVFDKVKATKRVTVADKQVMIELKCKVRHDLDSAKVGFKLKDPVDKPLLGTNTELCGVELKNLKRGETFILNFSFENLLNAGTYKLDVLAESMEGEIHDWLIDAAEIDVYKEQRTGYPIEPKITAKKVSD